MESPQNLSLSQSQNIVTDLEDGFTSYVKGIRRRRFPKAKGAYLHYFVPSISDPISVLAAALNSAEYKKIIED